jgi:hypothetical protein
MEMPYGGIKHFPAGTYDNQMATVTGQIELQLMDKAHSVWYAWKHLNLSQWGEYERKLAKWMMPEKIVAEPTRRLDSLIRRLWPYSWWARRVMRSVRELNDG